MPGFPFLLMLVHWPSLLLHLEDTAHHHQATIHHLLDKFPRHLDTVPPPLVIALTHQFFVLVQPVLPILLQVHLNRLLP